VIRWASVKPRPEPRLDRELSPLQNGSNTDVRWAGVSPGPESSTVTSTLPSVLAAVIATVPPAGV
jgi:hypothetical protein